MNYIGQLPEGAKKIPGVRAWATTDGKIYGKETRTFSRDGKVFYFKHYGEYFEYSLQVHQENGGYVYCTVLFENEDGTVRSKTFRAHILIAKTFIPNPDNLPIVGHRNNIKTDNRVENLYWTTWRENIQKAVDDGLLVNDKGYDDNQSKPVYMFETATNKLLGAYGSCHEAARETGYSLTTIARQAKYKRPVRKPYYFRYQDDESVLQYKCVETIER